MNSVDGVLNSYLQRQSPEVRLHLMRFLTPASKERLNALQGQVDLSLFSEEQGDQLFSHILWSWFLPTLQAYSSQEQSLFLAALDPKSREALAEQIPCHPHKEELKKMGRAYLRHLLLTSVLGAQERIPPIEALPPSSLNKLLQLSKNALIVLIDLLAMHDLASEMRQIVDTKILKNIYQPLTDLQKQVLKQVSLRPEPFSLPKIGLDRWEGSPEELRSLLHKKGLFRLRVALAGEATALSWYLAHQLDIGRGTALLKHPGREGTLSLAEVAKRQVEELINDEEFLAGQNA